MSLEGLITNYGYAAIGIGTFFEGETILILGGFAAHRGYLLLPWVIAWAFIGSLLGDQIFFYIGRYHGKIFLEKRPGWQAKSEKVLRLLETNQNWLMLSFRFLYGMRTITPFLLGASSVPALRFLLFNAVSALLWAIAIGSLGFIFGHTLELLLGDVKKYEVMAFGFLSLIGVGVWLYHLWKRK